MTTPGDPRDDDAGFRRDPLDGVDIGDEIRLDTLLAVHSLRLGSHAVFHVDRPYLHAVVLGFSDFGFVFEYVGGKRFFMHANLYPNIVASPLFQGDVERPVDLLHDGTCVRVAVDGRQMKMIGDAFPWAKSIWCTATEMWLGVPHGTFVHPWQHPATTGGLTVRLRRVMPLTQGARLNFSPAFIAQHNMWPNLRPGSIVAHGRRFGHMLCWTMKAGETFRRPPPPPPPLHQRHHASQAHRQAAGRRRVLPRVDERAVRNANPHRRAPNRPRPGERVADHLHLPAVDLAFRTPHQIRSNFCPHHDAAHLGSVISPCWCLFQCATITSSAGNQEGISQATAVRYDAALASYLMQSSERQVTRGPMGTLLQRYSRHRIRVDLYALWMTVFPYVTRWDDDDSYILTEQCSRVMRTLSCPEHHRLRAGTDGCGDWPASRACAIR